MERAVALARQNEVLVADLPDKIQRCKLPAAKSADGDSAESVGSLFDAERSHVLRAVQQFGGNKTRAAALLGIDRRTLYRRLMRYEAARSS